MEDFWGDAVISGFLSSFDRWDSGCATRLSPQTLVHEEKLTEESLKFRLAASQNAEL